MMKGEMLVEKRCCLWRVRMTLQERGFGFDIGDGGAKTDKFERDVRLLLKGLEDEPNNDRYTFYLANSYHDSGRFGEAINAYKKRIEFPELRREALQQYYYWRPDSVVIESKASGLPLTYELRKMGIPVINFTPSKGNDKHTRVNSVAPLFESGCIWAPTHKDFAQEVIEECAAFPYGDNDDLVDSMTQAVMRFRQGGFIEHPEDYREEPIITEERELY